MAHATPLSSFSSSSALSCYLMTTAAAAAMFSSQVLPAESASIDSSSSSKSLFYASSSNEIPHVKGMRSSTTLGISGSGISSPGGMMGGIPAEAQDWNGLFRLLSYILISGIGASGSIFIISALTVVSVLQVRGNSFLASLCVGHLIVTVFILPSTTIAIMSGAKGHSPLLCHYQWLATEATLMIHVLSFLLISFDSWKGMGKVHKYNHCCTKFRVILVVLSLWITTIALLTMQHVNNYAPNVCTSLGRRIVASTSSSTINKTMTTSSTVSTNPKHRQHQHPQQPPPAVVHQNFSILTSQADYLTTFSLEESIQQQQQLPSSSSTSSGVPELSITYHSVIGISFILIPTILTLIFFSRTLVIVKRHHVYMSENPLNPIYFLTDQNLLKSHVAVYALSVAMWSPICIIAIVDHFVASLDPSLIDTCWWLALANSCCFSFVYAFTNRDFGESFLQLFYYCCCKSHVNWVRKTTVGGLNQMAASRSMAQSVPSVSVTNHHHGHHAHHYQTSTSMSATTTGLQRGHGPGMGMVALGGGVSGGGICGGGPFRAFRQGRMTTDL